MDIFDEILNKTPKEKFFEIIKHGNLNAIENVIEDFICDYISMQELLEKQNITNNDVLNYKLSNGEILDQRKNDIFIELGAKILSQEG